MKVNEIFTKHKIKMLMCHRNSETLQPHNIPDLCWSSAI